MTDRLVNRSPLDPPNRSLSSAANLLQLREVIAPVLHLPILQQCGWDKLSPVLGDDFSSKKAFPRRFFGPTKRDENETDF